MKVKILKLLLKKKGMKQISDPATLKAIVNEVLDANTQSIEDYVAGKNRAVGFLVGQIMKKTGGQANPKVTNQILIQLLKERTE